MPDNFQHLVRQWSQNPIGVLRAIREDGQGHLNMDDLDVWLWYCVIVPKTHNSLFKRLVWCNILLTPGRFAMLAGNIKWLMPLIAQL